MKKITSTLLISFIVAANIFAQPPQAFKYQAVVRDNSGNVVTGQLVSIRIGIIQDSINGLLIYRETHSITTNQFGIIVLEIGRGTIETGIFNDIIWGEFSHFLKLELDETGGTNYQLMGTSELLSVPYASNTGSLTLTSPNGGYYEVLVDNDGNFGTNCNPMPSIANAGPSQDSICIPATLAANMPQIGTGTWSMVSGIGGSFADTTNPASQFSGIAGNAYTLRWTITNICGFTEDDTHISFVASPAFANAGIDQLNVFSPTTLAANTPGNGTGVWSIIDGTGGNFNDPNDPASAFSGIPNSAYTLRWTISTICDTTSDEVNIDFDNCPSTVSDLDGNSYNTVVIGTQCWMAENLNVGTMIDSNINQNQQTPEVIEKHCYSNIPDNCDTYGGLYQWLEAMQYNTSPGGQGICPTGWHLPTDMEWCTLENFVDTGTVSCTAFGWRGTDAGSQLKESGQEHWSPPNFGATNSSGFTALGSGYRFTNGSFYSANISTLFWLSDGNFPDGRIRALDFNNTKVYRNEINHMYSISVRCVKD